MPKFFPGEDMNEKNDRGSRPVPDPTVLTTQQLNREILSLKELLAARFEGYDKAIELLQARADKSPSIDVVDVNVKSLGALVDEKFKGVQIQFQERDIRTEQTSRDSKVAVDAALQAAKEAVGEQNKSSALAIAKSEAATTKQIDSIVLLIQSSNKGIDDKIDDMKNRLTTIEGAKAGGKEQTQSISTVVAIIAAIVSVLVPISVVIVTLAKAKP
jgi:hypothetical protein